MSQQLRVTRKLDVTGATVVGLNTSGEKFGGNVFYVDGIDGADGYDGKDPNYPKATVDSALGACTADNNDYIFVIDHWQEGATITVDKTCVHIIGMGSPQAPWVCLNVATDLHIFTLGATGNMVEIAGFNMGGGSTKSGINMVNCTGIWVHNNAFGHEYASDTPLYGMYVLNQNPSLALIEDNIFFGDQATGKGTITSNGIYQNYVGDAAGFVNSIIRRNVFMGLTGASDAGAIRLDGAGGVQILDNTFMTPDAASGEAINLLATVGCGGCIIAGNRAGNGMLNAGYNYNPYRDLNANTDNAWSMNYRGNSVIEPVGA